MNSPLLRRLSTFLRLLSPTNFARTFNYLRKYGVRLCFAKIVFRLSLVLGHRPSATHSLTLQPLAYKAGRNRGPLKRKAPNGSPLLDDRQDALKLELAAIKDGLIEELRHSSKTDG